MRLRFPLNRVGLGIVGGIAITIFALPAVFAASATGAGESIDQL